MLFALIMWGLKGIGFVIRCPYIHTLDYVGELLAQENPSDSPTFTRRFDPDRSHSEDEWRKYLKYPSVRHYKGQTKTHRGGGGFVPSRPAG